MVHGARTESVIFMEKHMPITINASFLGGNIVVEDITDHQVLVHQEIRDTDRDWFYWYFAVREAAGRTLTFQFTRSRALGVRGPAVSLDCGETWSWLGADCMGKNSFAYTFNETPEVRFSFAMPYQLSRWQRFIKGLQPKNVFTENTLCTTNQGRNVPYLLTGSPDPGYRVAITCRHHCCEMMAEYTLEGLVEWLVFSADTQAAWLRDNVQFFFAPFADLDGVENGDQGKGRRPRDHGRDYIGESLHAETRAIRAFVPEWSENRLRLGLDLHCPHISGEHNEVIYLVGSKTPEIAAEQLRFFAILESAACHLPVSAADFLPFGTAWNTGQNYTAGKGFSRWSAELPGVRLGTAIEIPYANARGTEVNQESARGFGIDLGNAIQEYLTTLS